MSKWMGAYLARANRLKTCWDDGANNRVHQRVFLPGPGQYRFHWEIPLIRNKLLRGMGMAAVILAAAACQGTDAGAGDRRDQRAADILAHLAALPAAEVVQVDDDAIPHFVTGNLGSLALAERIEDTDFRAALSAIAPAYFAREGVAARAEGPHCAPPGVTTDSS